MSETGFSMTTDAPAEAPAAEADAPLLPAEVGAEEAEDEDKANVIPVTKGDGGTYLVTDASGRKMVVKKLTQLERARMLEAIEDVASFQWIGMATVALSVRSLNNVPLPFPSTKKEVENRFVQLGDDGMEAAQSVLALAREGKVLNRYEVHGENPAIAKN